MKKLIVALLMCMPLTVFGEDISGTGWIFYYSNGSENILLFESNNTFTYLDLVSVSGNQGKVYGEEADTWMSSGKVLIVSYTGGYKVDTLTINNNGNGVSGTSINKAGLVQTVTGKLIK